jgi:transposase-like protein
MPNSHSHSSGPSPTEIERPRCPRCPNRMMLARIVPGPTGFDIRTFECSKCDHVFTLTVATDPMKSDVTGWLKGELGSEID